MKIHNCILFSLILLFAQCGNHQPTTPASEPTTSQLPVWKTINTSYYPLTAKDSIKNFKKYFPAGHQTIILALNRTDIDNIAKFDTIIIPRDLTGNVNQYTPYPQSLPFLKDISKLIYFSYPVQYFAAYEHGQLVRSGATNMGRQKDPTPTGLFYTNWKAEETKSTFNDEWDLKWNFNIQNKEGVGWHQYALPGYPASHSCLRLQEDDAKYLYTWASEWTIKGTDNILAKGTPVIVYGTYPFGSPKPWLKLLRDPHANDITTDQLQKETETFLPDIKASQARRDSVAAKK